MSKDAASILADALRSGDRRALARAITLVESTRDQHRAQAMSYWHNSRHRPGKHCVLASLGCRVRASRHLSNLWVYK